MFLGFVIRGINPAFIFSSRLSDSSIQEQIISVSSSSRKNVEAHDSEEEEKDNEDCSLARKPRVRICMFLDD